MLTETKLTLEGLHAMVLREVETDAILEIDSSTYLAISDFVGTLRRQEYDGVENSIRDAMVKTARELIEVLIRTRLEKGTRLSALETGHLLDEEKYILDAEDQKKQRMRVVTEATSRGKTQLLEHISQVHRGRMVVVRFVRDVDALTGSDYNPYGPFRKEDVATIPHDNAQALVARGGAVRIDWID